MWMSHYCTLIIYRIAMSNPYLPFMVLALHHSHNTHTGRSYGTEIEMIGHDEDVQLLRLLSQLPIANIAIQIMERDQQETLQHHRDLPAHM
jgi:hypothetical protein